MNINKSKKLVIGLLESNGFVKVRAVKHGVMYRNYETNTIINISGSPRRNDWYRAPIAEMRRAGFNVSHL